MHSTVIIEFYYILYVIKVYHSQRECYSRNMNMHVAHIVGWATSEGLVKCLPDLLAMR